MQTTVFSILNTLTATVSPANLGTQTNSNMTGQKMERNGASISNGTITHRNKSLRETKQVSIKSIQNEVTGSIHSLMARPGENRKLNLENKKEHFINKYLTTRTDKRARKYSSFWFTWSALKRASKMAEKPRRPGSHHQHGRPTSSTASLKYAPQLAWLSVQETF